MILCCGEGFSGLLAWGDLYYAQIFAELFCQLSDRSLDFSIYAGVAVRLLMTAIFAGIGVMRFKAGLIAEVTLSVVNIGYNLWLTFQAALH